MYQGRTVFSIYAVVGKVYATQTERRVFSNDVLQSSLFVTKQLDHSEYAKSDTQYYNEEHEKNPAHDELYFGSGICRSHELLNLLG